MTRREFPLKKHQFFDICMNGERADKSPIYNIEKIEDIKKVFKKFGKGKEYMNGKGLFSLLLPSDLYYEKKNDVSEKEPIVKIWKGVLVEGVLDKGILGAEHGSLIQILNKEYGSCITANFIDNVTLMGNAWLSLYGYSIGLEDCMITSDKSIKTLKETLASCYAKAEGIENTTQNAGIREVRVTGALSQARDIGMRIAKDAMSPDNNFLTAIISKAKGDYFNISQITGLLGQQNLEGKRVGYQLNHGKRTMIHYPFGKMDKEREYESRGFIRNSFNHGLNPHEFFFHAMSGREGVIDKQLCQ